MRPLKELRRHINGKDGNPKDLGPNPLEYVGVTYSNDGSTATLWEKTSGNALRNWMKWVGRWYPSGNDHSLIADQYFPVPEAPNRTTLP
jgi:hypothetical protein